MTQCEEVKEYLNSGKVLTRAVAAGDLYIFELSSRIGELESEGYKVRKKRVKYKSPRSGRAIHMVEYTKA